MAFIIGFRKWLVTYAGAIALLLSFAFTVRAQTAPTFTSMPVETGAYGSSYTYNITTTDTDGNTRAISISAGSLPAGLTFTDNTDGTALISGVPTEVGTGSFPFELTVLETNGAGLSSTQQVNLEIAKATLIVTADDQTRIYGDANPVLSVTYSGFLNGDDEGDIVAPIANTTATASSGVNTYPITLTNGSATNYTLSLVDGTLNIDAKSLTATANPQTKIYGQSNPVLTISYAGFVNGDDAGDITEPAISTLADDASSVGGYAITLTGGSSSNYTMTLVNGILTINPAALTATAANKTKTYGQTNPALTIIYSGFVNGDDAGDITEPAISTLATDASEVGGYAITLSGGSASNYTMTLVNGTLTISPAALTATAANKTKTYGQTNQALTIIYSGFVNGDDAGDITEPAISTLSTDASDVGSYAITLSGGSSLNYTLTLVNGTLTISPAALTVTAANKTKTYGQINPALTITYSGFVNGDDAGDITEPAISTLATDASSVGGYAITLTGGSASNYTITLVNGTLTINPAALTATAVNKTKTYGQSNPVLTISYAGFVNGDHAGDITEPSISTLATDASGVGSYAIALTAGSALNYTMMLVNGTLTINPAALTATAANKTKTYGQTNPALTITYSGFVNGDDTGDITEPAISTLATDASDVGGYAITLSGGSSLNYTLTLVNGTLTINPTALTVTAANKTKTYGQVNPALTIDYSGFVNGDNAGDITEPAISTLATDASGVGGYPITLSGGAASNYVLTLINGSLTIIPASLTATAVDKTKIYAQANPTLTISYVGFVNGDIAGSITQPSISTTAATGSSVGSYPITLSGGVASNYTLTLINGSLTISPASLTATAVNKTKTYGQANPTLTISYTGFVNGDGVGNITEPSISTTATAASGVGSYPIALSGGSSSNYTFTLVNGSLSITPAGLTATAANKTKTYGQANPVLTINYSGFMNGDGVGNITEPSISTTATAASGVGSYPITLSGGISSNYTFTLINGSLSITPAGLMINAVNKTKTYGQANPVLTLTYGGFVNGDGIGNIVEPTISTTAVAGSNVGSYPITLIGGSASNYTITLVNGSLTVIPAGLTATATNKTKTYAQANPALTINYSGFVNGDGVGSITQPAISTTATTGSVVGSYPISLTGGSASNYTITLVNGTLTITPAGLTATAVNKSKTYAQVNPTLTISYSGFVNGDGVGNITEPSITTTAVTGSGVGNYPITLNGGSAANYSIMLVNGTLTITPAGLTVTAVNKTKTYAQANPALTMSYSGFVNGDGTGNITQPSISTTATTSSNVGVYPITLTGGSAANYTLTLVNGSLTIGKASLTATADDKSRLFGFANPAFTITYSGFVNGDTFSVLDTPPTATTTAIASSPLGGYPITVSGGSDNNYSFNYVNGTLTVLNGPPSTSGIADVNVNEDASNSSINLYAAFSDLEDSDANLTYVVFSNTNPGLFESVTISAGTLTLDYKLNMFGTSNITIRTTDTGGLHVDDTFIVSVASIQDTPIFTSTALTGAVQGQVYQYSITATDPDPGDVLTISGLIIPSWATFVDNGNGTALLSGTPNSTNVGTTGNGVALKVSDDKGNFSNSIFTITVVNTNDTPDFTSTAPTSATQNASYAYSIIALDDDSGDVLTFTAPIKPAWLTLTDNGNRTATLSGTPLNAHVGANVVQLKVTDGFSAFSTQNFTINVININDPPFFVSAPVTTINQDQVYSYQITTGDPDVGDHVTIIALTKPSWLTFTDNGNGTALLTGTPNNAQVGPHTISIQVTDASNQSIRQDFTINVININDPPYFVSAPVTAVNQDQVYSYPITTGDPDVGDHVMIIALTKPSWLTFTDNGNGTATLSGTPLNGHVGSNVVQLKVTDASSTLAVQNFTINVINVNDLPFFVSMPITAINQNQIYSYSIETSDPDVGDHATITALTKPLWLTLTDNGNGTAMLTGTPGNAQVGTHTISIQVADASNQSWKQDFTIIVSNVNDTPYFFSTAVTTANEDAVYTYSVEARDVDSGDVLVLSAPNLPGWLHLDNPGNGTAVLTGIPMNVHVGVTSILLKVRDVAGAEINQVFDLSVINTNDAPQFTSSPVTGIPEDSFYEYQITFSDPDVGDVIVISTSSLPAWLNFSQGTSGIAFLRGTPKNEDVGNASITITLRDASGSIENQNFQLTVSNVNDPPVFLSNPRLKVAVGESYVYDITTSDPDTGDGVTLSPVLLPSFLSVTDNGNGSGKLSGTITSAILTSNRVVIRATDKSGVHVDQAFEFIVNNPPTLKAFKVDANEDTPVELTYSVFSQNFTDPGDALTLVKVKSLPAKGTLLWNDKAVTVGSDVIATNSTWSGFIYLPGPDFNGSDAFQWNASDGTSFATSDATVTIQVKSVNDPPVVGNVGAEILSYGLGDAGVEVFKGLTINDVDNSYLRSATLVINENYVLGDVLELPKEFSTPVKAAFDSQKGELVLTGRETKSNYESLLAKVLFSSPVTSSNTEISKKITLMVNDSLDNSNVVSKIVQITEVFPELDIVNSFTPNQDGVNDVWDVLNLQFYKSIKISIFDGNNNRVFTCKEQNCAWDGKANGQELPPGRYFYVIDLNDGKRQYQGTVTILR